MGASVYAPACSLVRPRPCIFRFPDAMIDDPERARTVAPTYKNRHALSDNTVALAHHCKRTDDWSSCQPAGCDSESGWKDPGFSRPVPAAVGLYDHGGYV